MRIGLGCQRLTDGAVLTAALDAGMTLFDTARAYGESERLVADAVSGRDVHVVTKCGMRRDGEAWIPDGRAASIARDVDVSATLLGTPIDTLLLHAPDPRTPLATSLRALERARESGVVRRIGVSNVTRRELEACLAIAPVEVVEVSLGAYHDAPVRDGLVALSVERNLALLAYAPLGGPTRAPRLARDPALRQLAAVGTPAELVLAYLLALSPVIAPIVGARRVESAWSAARAASLTLDEATLAALDARFPGLALARSRPRPATSGDREVVMLMGVPGAGKSRAAAAYVARGYERLSRDELGGTLAGIARRLDERLRAGASRVVLDNTYVSRVARSEVVRLASVHGARARCVFFDTPPHEAEVNLARRMLERHGELLGPEAIAARARTEPGTFAPTALFRLVRELESPSPDEGFATIETVPFVREHEDGIPGALVALDAAREHGLRALRGEGPVVLVGWYPGVAEVPDDVRSLAASLADATGRPVEVALCAHGGGPPKCWCRPPLPGLWVSFARRRRVDPRRSVAVGTSAAHRVMASRLGLAYEEPGS